MSNGYRKRRYVCTYAYLLLHYDDYYYPWRLLVLSDELYVDFEIAFKLSEGEILFTSPTAATTTIHHFPSN